MENRLLLSLKRWWRSQWVQYLTKIRGYPFNVIGLAEAVPEAELGLSVPGGDAGGPSPVGDSEFRSAALELFGVIG